MMDICQFELFNNLEHNNLYSSRYNQSFFHYYKKRNYNQMNHFNEQNNMDNYFTKKMKLINSEGKEVKNIDNIILENNLDKMNRKSFCKCSDIFMNDYYII